MASGTFRSNSSASTYLDINLYEISRNQTQVTIRCDWTVRTGSATSLGAIYNRTLYITHVNGTALGSSLIKNNTTWNTSSSYSGSFEFSVDVGTYGSGVSSMIPSTSAEGTQSCVWTTYVSQLDVAFSQFSSDATSPSSPTVRTSPFENSVELSFTAGSDGINNPITAYHLYYRIDGGAEVGIDIGLSTSYTLNTSGISRGSYLEFHVACISSRNIAWSGWSNSGRKNSAPYTPVGASVPKTTYIPGENIPVTFAGNGDVDGNLTGYEIATDVDETIVAYGTVSPMNVNTTGWSQGITRRFRVRAIDAFGVRSGWSTYTAAVTLNTVPNLPEISYPVQGAIIYNRRPRILVKAGTTNDGPKHIFCINDGSEKTTAANGDLFSCTTNDSLPSVAPLVFKPSDDYALGTAGVSARMYDGYLYSDYVSRSFTIATLSFTDPILTAGVTKVKALHITELQTAINAIRGAYGFSNYVFTACIAGVTLIGNITLITEMQTAVQEIINRINGWDSGSSIFDISISWVSVIAKGGGVDATNLRLAIEQLRTILTQI